MKGQAGCPPVGGCLPSLGTEMQFGKLPADLKSWDTAEFWEKEVYRPKRSYTSHLHQCLEAKTAMWL